jgi:hypothetical protein
MFGGNDAGSAANAALAISAAPESAMIHFPVIGILPFVVDRDYRGRDAKSLAQRGS